HDILPGSSIDWVYEDAERDLLEVLTEATAIAGDACAGIAGDEGENVAVFNPTSHVRAFQGIEVPPCGWTVTAPSPVMDPVVVTGTSLENALLRVRWDSRGCVTSIWDKEVGREVLSGPGNVLELHEDNPRRWDAWDLDIEHRGAHVTVAFNGIFGDSEVRQTISLAGGSRVIQFHTDVDWHERHKILKVA